ncbi:Bifunctional protein hldE [Chromobacterium violaceum]|uniref:Bifunctional protein hldE n=1 Tax=Chromobacterium violaceum TaxID=536 RepID=A0A447TGJ4_CHRVL|nr:Bifunctional protein hldE [Chromobacterium violaceum]
MKLRVVARQQQLIRLDFEDAPSHEILADKLEEFTDIVAAHDVVILSDYGKGGLTHVAEMIQLAAPPASRC